MRGNDGWRGRGWGWGWRFGGSPEFVKPPFRRQQEERKGQSESEQRR
jgi:hypothetical protein